MGSIIWRKKTTVNTTGGAVVMGSYPYPPNGIVEIDFEYILLFKKPGQCPRGIPGDQGAVRAHEGGMEVAGSRATGTWAARARKGTRRRFPRRSPGGSSGCSASPATRSSIPSSDGDTTARVALALGRNAVGYEIRADYVQPGAQPADLFVEAMTIVVPEREADTGCRQETVSTPRIPDMVPDALAAAAATAPGPPLHTVIAVRSDCSLALDSGTMCPVPRAGDPGPAGRPRLPPGARAEEEGLPQGRVRRAGVRGSGEDHSQEQDLDQRTARKIGGGPGCPSVRGGKGAWCTGSGTRLPSVDNGAVRRVERGGGRQRHARRGHEHLVQRHAARRHRAHHRGPGLQRAGRGDAARRTSDFPASWESA